LNIKKIILRLAENWPAKMLSLAFALILFMFNQMSNLSTRTFLVPLSIEANPALAVISPESLNARVSLRSSDEGIKSILDGDIEAFVDLGRHETEGLYHAPVQIRKKGSALTVEPLEITVRPQQIAVSLDRRLSKTLPVFADIRGHAAAGFDLVSFSVSPEEIAVSGPLSILEPIESLKTTPAGIEGRNSDFRVMVNVPSPDPLVSIRGDGRAELFIIIRPSVLVRNVDGIPFALSGLREGLYADLAGRTGSIRIEAEQSKLDSFRPHYGAFIVDCSAISEPGAYTLPANVELPDGFTLLRHEPDEITLTVTQIGEW
jgi:YbbR domain-containing protein